MSLPDFFSIALCHCQFFKKRRAFAMELDYLNHTKNNAKIIPLRLLSVINTLMVAARPPPSLTDALRHYRAEQAYLRAIPPSSVFSNKLLTSIANSRPTTLNSLQKLRGIGPVRCDNYGRDIVRLVNLDAKRRGKRTKDRPAKIPAARTKEAKGKRIAKGRAGNVKEKSIPNKVIAAKKAVSKSFISGQEVVKKGEAPKIVTSRFFPGIPMGSAVSLSTQPSLQEAAGIIIPPRLPPSPKSSVYILELEDGRVYVGSSRDVPRRVSQHTNGSGSAYTRVYKPTGVLLPRLGNVEGDGDAAERDETLRYMMLRGIPFVRGWKFARVDMTSEEFDEAESNIRELFDLCRKCGYKGHFCTHCKATFDRLGNPIGR